MSSWGTKIGSDDLGADVISEFLELYDSGKEVKEIEKLDKFKESKELYNK